jgi:hypothetical protein
MYLGDYSPFDLDGDYEEDLATETTRSPSTIGQQVNDISPLFEKLPLMEFDLEEGSTGSEKSGSVISREDAIEQENFRKIPEFKLKIEAVDRTSLALLRFLGLNKN